MLGELCALGAAFTWGLSVILFKRSERASPAAINLFKNVLAALLLLASFPLFGVHFDLARSQSDWLRLIISGVLGIAIADTLMLFALRKLGAGLFAVVECSYAPVIVTLGVVLLGEPVSRALLLGGGLVVGGVLWAVTERNAKIAGPEAELGRRERTLAIAAGASGIISMGLGVIVAKPVLESGQLLEVTLVRLIAGIAAQLLWITFVPSGRHILSVFRPSKTWRTLVPASVLGSYFAVLLWLGGFKWAPASTAAVLNQTSSLFTIALAWLVLGERASRRRLTGAALALGGALVVLLR